MTMARVICLSGILTEVQEHAFSTICDDNPVKCCSELGEFNFELFKDCEQGTSGPSDGDACSCQNKGCNCSPGSCQCQPGNCQCQQKHGQCQHQPLLDLNLNPLLDVTVTI